MIASFCRNHTLRPTKQPEDLFRLAPVRIWLIVDLMTLSVHERPGGNPADDKRNLMAD